jgi:hypothetical protein
MSQATDYLEEKILDAMATLGSFDFASGTVTSGSGGYIGLFTSAPSDSAAGTEVSASGTAYTRIQIGSAGQGSFNAASGGEIDNDAEFRWADALADWGTITHVGLFDASTGGNLLVYGQLQSSVVIELGDIFKVPANGFTIQMN